MRRLIRREWKNRKSQKLRVITKRGGDQFHLRRKMVEKQRRQNQRGIRKEKEIKLSG